MGKIIFNNKERDENGTSFWRPSQQKISLIGERWLDKAGCMTMLQIRTLKKALLRAHEKPSLLCDLEGCGPVATLENNFAQFCGTKFALAVSSGTAAIHTALLSAGIGPGDEVIVSPYSWPQSVSPVIYTGAIPVFADIHPRTLTLDPDSVLGRINAKTKAILPVHLFGHVADMVKLEEIARKYDILLISDAAHSLGATLYRRPIASYGDIACFSLGRGKLVTGGEGGIIVTSNANLFEKAVALTQHSERSRRMNGPGRYVDCFSLNYRIHPLAALLALSDLTTMRKKLAHRKAVFQAFRGGLGKHGGISFQATLPGEITAYYGIPLTYTRDQQREPFSALLQKKGVPLRCGPVGSPLHLQMRDQKTPKVLFHATHAEGACPVTEKRCVKQELWALSPLDMDVVSPDEASFMGQILQESILKPTTFPYVKCP